MRFWDSSAVVPLILVEPSRESVLQLLVDDQEMVVWWGTEVECASAITRREREGSLELDQATEVLARLRALAASWHEVQPSIQLKTVALRLLRTHPLRTADALQLAAAIIAAEHEPLFLPFVSLDQRLSTAAVREGFGSPKLV